MMSEVETKVEAVPAPVSPRRRKVGTGTLARRKAWLCAMACEPGLFFPFRVLSPNRKTHWAKHAAHYEAARLVIGGNVKAAIHNGLTPPVRVTLKRYGRKLLDGHDNLAMSFKPLVDEIAIAFGKTDNDPGFEWVYEDECAPWYGVRVTLMKLESACV